MTDLRTAIQEYIKVAETLLQHGLRDGSLTVAEAKQDAVEIEKWQEKLAMLENEKGTA